MKVVVTYDVSTTDSAGRTRLRKVAKICENYGVRVQNSVFECVVDSTQLAKMRFQLIDAINDEEDSLRFYRLGNNYQNKVEHIGAKLALDVEDTLIL